MKTTSIFSLAILLTALAVGEAAGQSGRAYRRSAVMNGNQVRTVFGNWGVIGQPSDTRPRGAWRNDNNGYLGDVSPFVGAEVRWRDTTFRSVVTPPVDRPAGSRDESPEGVPWAMEPVNGYFGPAPNQSIALSNDKATWPTEWPDKMSDPSDPGWKGSWNGYFGKRISADLETYFVMDDNNDLRFNVANNNPRRIEFHPDSVNTVRNGLGLTIRVRGLQWAQFLAQDNIFWLYEIENTGTTTYDRVVFGMLVGTYVGVTGSQDAAQEYEDDWSFYDVNENITYTGDYGKSTARNPRWNQDFPVGMVGYAFLESPGNPFDGIDNDADGDSSSVGQTFPQFSATSFDSTLITRGQRIVLIQNDFTRVSYTVPSRDSVRIYTRGMKDSIWIYPGRTKVVEGNVVRDQLGNQVVNRNSYDGFDNDFDGLIDENQFLHYRQYKVNRNPPFQVLIDILRPVRYVDRVFPPPGINPAAMIDERRDDGVDNDGDWNLEFDDVGRDGIGPTAVNYPGPDFGESDGVPTSGYDLLGNDSGLPGEPNIDKTDVNESDQIGLSSFYYFTPANVVRLGDDEELWKNLAPGFFDVPTSISNNRPVAGEDGDFIYGSGYFPLRAKSIERFSLALVYGGGKGGSVDEDIADLLKNKKTVQRIYDANYQFPTPPDKPTLTAVPGDGRVTLYWDRVAEESVDPVLRVKDFEGYKLYKSTDPDFSDIFTITDGAGNPRGYRPLGQFDIKDQITGYFRPSQELFEAAQGYSFFLGDDTGLQHTFVDSNVDNGRRYYYAVVAYDRGDEAAGIFPGENTKQVSVLSTGEVVADINVAVVVPNAPVAGYVPPKDALPLSKVAGPATGDATYSMVDQTRLTGHTYKVTFLDSQIDGKDNNANGILDAADSTEWTRLTTSYSVLDENPVNEQFAGADTALVTLQRKNLVPGSDVVKNESGGVVPPASYTINYPRGTIQGTSAGSLPAGTYTLSYLYYPVYQSPNVQGSPFLVENTESDIFDGVSVNFRNYWYVKDTLYVDGRPSGWVGPNAYGLDWGPANFAVLNPPITGYRRPADYQIEFADNVVDTAVAGSGEWSSVLLPTPVNYRIFNLTEQRYVKFYLYEQTWPGKLSPGDNGILLEEDPRGNLAPTWAFFAKNKEGEPGDTLYALGSGDFYIRTTTKSLGVRDTLRLKTDLPSTNAAVAQTSLDDIRVVPNPYVTAASFEQPLPPGVTSGRGERKVDFTNVPAGSTIRVFTSRGDHVVTLRHDGGIENGTVSWNLRTTENLDIAFGVYFYVVESPAGTKTGKLAIIK